MAQPGIRVFNRRQEYDVTFFQESRWQPSETLPAEHVSYYREVLIVHANFPGSGKCRVCRQAGCLDWRSAYDHLASAGELMARPEQWLTATGTSGQSAQPEAATS